MIIKSKNFIYIVLSLILLGLSIVLVNNSNKSDTIQTSGSLELSNAKIEWGIKRGDNNNQQ